MVVFTCNNCGQSIRRNQVDKHFQFRCRIAKSLSCMDCGKDFYAEDYKKHTKCISESEKYGGKDYVPSVNKGEVKQEQWIENIQNAISTTKMSKELRNLMEQLTQYNNIPRKRIRFENFIRNSVRVKNVRLINEAWEIFSMAQKPKKDEQNESDEKVKSKQAETDQGEEILQNGSENDNGKKKKNKKRKMEEESEVLQNPSENGSAKSKKRKYEDAEVSENCAENDSEEQVDEEVTQKKFKWKKVIIQVLREADDHELSLKKLRKKVLAEYMAFGESGRQYDQNELYAKFEKKVSKNPKFKVFKDRVKLKE